MASRGQIGRADLQLMMDLMAQAARVEDDEGLKSVCLGTGDLIDFENCAVALGRAAPDGSLMGFDALNVCFDPSFAETYITERIFDHDPSVRAHFRNFGLRHWSDFVRNVPQMRELYSGFGIRETYIGGLPASGGGGSFFCISGGRLPDSPRARVLLEAIVPHIHQCLLRLRRKERQPGPALSQRELEVLKWVASGKSSWDISMILGISERTVNYHADNILRKLDASTRAHAVAIAFGLGLIDAPL